jgi:hypothetical protein
VAFIDKRESELNNELVDIIVTRQKLNGYYERRHNDLLGKHIADVVCTQETAISNGD